MNEIGIMQGRLSPAVPGRLQAFPWSTWEKEFCHAATCGFEVIEWLFEADRYEQNPIWTQDGVQRIRQKMATTGIRLRSLCADYFMVHPFFRVSEPERTQSIAVLNRLILQSAGVGIKTILLPVLEGAGIRADTEKIQLLDALCEPLSLAIRHGIRLGLETELPAAEYRALVERGNHPALGVYFDTGNAVAKGYDIAADIRMLGPFLCGVHIKDRTRGGPSVLLGQGDADFTSFFQAMGETAYIGPLVLETPSGNDFLAVAGTHLKYVREYCNQAPAEVDSVRQVSR